MSLDKIKIQINQNLQEQDFNAVLKNIDEYFKELNESPLKVLETLVLAKKVADATGKHSISALYGSLLADAKDMIDTAGPLSVPESEAKELYNQYWKEYFKFEATYKNHELNDLCLKSGLEFESVLEVGTGNGDGVKKMLAAGKKARGIEYSNYLYENLLKDKFPDGEVVEGDAADIPFDDNSFDMIVSFDVLEHIPEHRISKVAQEFARVSKKYLFVTISSNIDIHQKFHLTLRPDEWWKEKFESAGFVYIKDRYPALMNDQELHVYEKIT